MSSRVHTSPPAARVMPVWLGKYTGMRMHSKAKTPLAKLSKLTKRTVGSLRQKAMRLGIKLGHRR